MGLNSLVSEREKMEGNLKNVLKQVSGRVGASDYSQVNRLNVQGNSLEEVKRPTGPHMKRKKVIIDKPQQSLDEGSRCGTLSSSDPISDWIRVGQLGRSRTSIWDNEAGPSGTKNKTQVEIRSSPKDKIRPKRGYKAKLENRGVKTSVIKENQGKKVGENGESIVKKGFSNEVVDEVQKKEDDSLVSR